MKTAAMKMAAVFCSENRKPKEKIKKKIFTNDGIYSTIWEETNDTRTD